MSEQDPTMIRRTLDRAPGIRVKRRRLTETEVIQELQHTIDRLTAGRRRLEILEAGCGSSSHLSFPGDAHVVGIDVSPTQLARNTCINEAICGDIQTHTFDSERFDVIVCWDVLEHLPRPTQALANFASALKPGGLLVVGLPNLFSLKGLVAKFTPLRFHIWVFRTLFRSASWSAFRTLAGRDDHGPFKTYLRLAVAPARLRQFGLRNGMSPRYFKSYESGVQIELRSRFGLKGPAWTSLRFVVRIATAGLVDLEATDSVLLFQRVESS